MNRRDFLKILGIGVAAPKLIFDMGKNSRLYALAERDRLLKATPRLVIPPTVSDMDAAWNRAFPCSDVPENMIYIINPDDIEYRIVRAARWENPRQNGVITGLDV